MFRFIGTARTAKHRIFSFLQAGTVAESEVVAISSDDPFVMGVLSSRTNMVWSLARGGTLEDRPRYNNSVCFDPFPFPAADDLQKHRIRQIAEELDARTENACSRNMRI